MLRLDWKLKGKEGNVELYELLITENNDGEWVDVSSRYGVINKKYGTVYLLSLKELFISEQNTDTGDKLIFYNVHVLNKEKRVFEPLSIFAKHSYLRNALSGIYERGEQFCILGSVAEKHLKDKGIGWFFKYTIVPTSTDLAQSLANVEHVPNAYGERVTADDFIDLDFFQFSGEDKQNDNDDKQKGVEGEQKGDTKRA